MNKDVRKIADASLMVAIIGIMLYFNRQTAGAVELLFCWAIPIPLVIYSAKYGLKYGLLPFAGMLIFVILFGAVQTFYYFIVYGVVGLIYGNGVKAQWKTKKLLFFTLVVSLVSTIITTVLFASFFGYDISRDTQEISQLLTNNFGAMEGVLAVNFSQMILLISAFTLVASALMEGLLIHLLSTLLLRRLGFKVEKSKSLLEYNIPKWTGYVALLFVVGGEYAIREPLSTTVLTAIMVGYLIAQFYLIVFGYLGIVLVAKQKINKNVSIYLMLFTVLLINIALPLLMFSGFLFITTDWRQKFLRRAQHG